MRCLTTLILSLIAYGGIAQQDTAFIYTFGGELEEQGRDIDTTSDGGFVVVGATSSFGHGNSDVYLLKVDSNLNYEWSRAIGDFNLEFAHAMEQTPDNGFIIAGYSNSNSGHDYDGYLVKTNDTGGVEWTKYIGGNDWDKFHDIVLTSDNGYLVVGETFSFGVGDADAWVIKTDSAGNIEWEKTYGGNKKDAAYAIIKTKDGNYAFCGENGSYAPNLMQNAWLAKINIQGDTIFNSYYDRYGLKEAFNSLVETSDSDFVCVGWIDPPSNTNWGKNELAIRFDHNGIKTDDNHDLINTHEDVFTGVVESGSNGIITSGYTNSVGAGLLGRSFGIRTFELTESLAIIGRDYIVGQGEFDQKGYDIAKNSSSRVITGYYRGSNNTYSDACIIKFTSDTVAKNYVEVEVHQFVEQRDQVLSVDKPELRSIQVWPNPVEDVLSFQFDPHYTSFQFELYEINGRIVLSKTVYSKTYELDLSDLAPGPYFLKAHSQEKLILNKLIIKQ